MFREAAIVGSLDVQLVYFRGMEGFNGECKASNWVSDPLVLPRLMGKISVRNWRNADWEGSELTAPREASQRKINAVVLLEMPAKSIGISLWCP